MLELLRGLAISHRVWLQARAIGRTTSRDRRPGWGEDGLEWSGKQDDDERFATLALELSGNPALALRVGMRCINNADWSIRARGVGVLALLSDPGASAVAAVVGLIRQLATHEPFYEDLFDYDRSDADDSPEQLRAQMRESEAVRLERGRFRFLVAHLEANPRFAGQVARACLGRPLPPAKPGAPARSVNAEATPYAGQRGAQLLTRLAEHWAYCPECQAAALECIGGEYGPEAADICSQAVASLDRAASEKAVPQLLEACRGGLVYAGLALCRIGTVHHDGTVPAVLALILDENTWRSGETLSVVKALANLGRDAAPALADIARHHPERSHRKVAIKTIALMGMPAAQEALPAAAEALWDEDEEIRDVAERALRIAGHGDVVLNLARRHVVSEERAVRQRTLEVLVLVSGLSGDCADEVPPVLGNLLEDPEPGLRLQAAKAAARLVSSKRIATALRAGLTSRDDELRAEAVKTVGEVAAFGAPWAGHVRGYAEAFAPLVAAQLADERGPVRLRAVEALGRMGPGATAALPALVAFAEARQDGMQAKDRDWVRTRGMRGAIAYAEDVVLAENARKAIQTIRGERPPVRNAQS